MNQFFQNIFTGFTLLEWCILGVFFLVYCIRLIYLLLSRGKIILAGKREGIANEKAMQPVSVILTARNEEENLKRILPQLLQFVNIEYEVVAVDDYSQDNTFTVLGAFNHKFSHLKISSLNEETRFSIKLAQNIALKSAKNDWVLIAPVSAANFEKDWLMSFAGNTTTSNRNLLISYSSIKPEKGYYNSLLRIENFMQHIKSAGFILNKVPFVYHEDNIAFKKDQYFALGGFGFNVKEHYANLELIVNSFIKKHSTVVLFNQETKLIKEENATRESYVELLYKSFRIEHHLVSWKKIILRLEELTSLLFLPLLILLLSIKLALWPLVTVLLGLLFLTQIVTIKLLLNRLNERKIFISSLLYGLFMPYIKPFYRWLFSKHNRKNKWRSKV